MINPKNLIPVGVSNRHFHISPKDIETVFGKSYQLRRLRDISQKGQYACHESLDVVGPKGKIERIRIVGPPRGRTQLEIARSDAYRLGIDPPVRYSGDLVGSAGIKVIGPNGELILKEGVIVPQRHIHMDSRTARKFGVKDRDRVFVAPKVNEIIEPGCEPRTTIFANVLIRVDDSFVLDYHIDIDEANATGLKTGDHVYILGKDIKTQPVIQRHLITENDVRRAMLQHRKIIVAKDTKVTPAALELAKAHDIFEYG